MYFFPVFFFISLSLALSLSLFLSLVSGYNLHWLSLWLFRVHWLQISRVAINPSEEDGVRVIDLCFSSSAHEEGSTVSGTVDEETRAATKSEKIKSFPEEIHPHHHSSRRRTQTAVQVSLSRAFVRMLTFSSWANFLCLLSSISTSARL